jgi:hypothetical protein
VLVTKIANMNIWLWLGNPDTPGICPDTGHMFGHPIDNPDTPSIYMDSILLSFLVLGIFD